MLHAIVEKAAEGVLELYIKATLDLTSMEYVHIAEGAFSRVLKCKWKGQDIALKIQTRSPQMEKSFLREISYLR